VRDALGKGEGTGDPLDAVVRTLVRVDRLDVFDELPAVISVREQGVGSRV